MVVERRRVACPAQPASALTVKKHANHPSHYRRQFGGIRLPVVQRSICTWRPVVSLL